MEEKILIKSQQYSAKKLLLIMFLALTLILIIALTLSMASIASDGKRYDRCVWMCDTTSQEPYEHSDSCSIDSTGECLLVTYPSKTAYIVGSTVDFYYNYHIVEYGTIFLVYGACLLIAFLVFLSLKNYEMTVTDKRIYGRVSWGKRVDLPLDSVSAISTVSILKGVAASTSSGSIKFLLIKNAKEIYQIMNHQLIERQKNTQAVAQPTIVQSAAACNADELKKYKELLDAGIISQEDFEAKKKQLLGL